LPGAARASAWIIFGAVAVASAGAALHAFISAPGSGGLNLTSRFFLEQDRFPLLFTAALLLAFSFWRKPTSGRSQFAALPRTWACLPLGLSVAAIAGSAWGTFVLFRGFHLSRDELMADFDARIIASGALVAQVPEKWQAFRGALAPLFMLPISEPFWVSSYLPGNAALRAAVSMVADPGWTNPLLLGLAVLSLASIAGRLWPGQRGPQLVALLLLVTSPQALTMAMTSYAMTAHLALNLLWLALFLRGDTRGYLGAVLVGWLATGLHQSIFHLLFAAPFIAGLWFEGRRTVAARIVLAYLAIFSFWTLYPKLVLASAGLTGEGGADLGVTYVAVKVLWLLGGFSIASVDLMLKNLLRAAAWQNVAISSLCRLPGRRSGAATGSPVSLPPAAC
jgi:hypothetical protein